MTSFVDSTYVKNEFGRVGLGRNPVDRGRKALKISALTDQDDIVHNLRCDPANTSDFRLFTPMLSSMLINLRRIEVFADRGYDSRRNRDGAYQRGFLPRIMRRRYRSSRRQNQCASNVQPNFRDCRQGPAPWLVGLDGCMSNTNENYSCYP